MVSSSIFRHIQYSVNTYCIYTYCDGSKVSFALSSCILVLKVEGSGPNTNNVPQRHLHLAQKIIVLQGRRVVVHVVHDEPEWLELLEPVLHLDGFAELWIQTVLYSLRAGVLMCVCVCVRACVCVCACVCVWGGGGGGGEFTSQLTTTVGKCYLQELCRGHLSTSCHATLAKNYYSQCSVGLSLEFVEAKKPD